MFRGENPFRSIRAGFAAAALVCSCAVSASAGIGPVLDDPSALPATVTRESRPLGPAPIGPDGVGPGVQPAAGSGWFVRTALSLGGVLTLIVVSGTITRAIARGRGGLAGAFGPGGRAPSGVISVLGRYPVSRGQKLVLLHLDRRILLVSQSAGGRLGTGGGMATLCEITDPDEVASILIKSRDAESDSMSERFRSILGVVDKAFRPNADQRPDHEFRKVFAGDGGDRAELWNDRAVASPADLPVEFPMKQPGPPEHDAVGSLRRRLAALRSDSPSEVPA